MKLQLLRKFLAYKKWEGTNELILRRYCGSHSKLILRNPTAKAIAKALHSMNAATV